MDMKEDKQLAFLTLILTRIRVRASDLGRVANTNLGSKRTSLNVRNRMRRRYSGHLFFFLSCDSAVSFLDIEKPSQRRLLLCLAPCRVHFARPWTQASKPALTDSSLAWTQASKPALTDSSLAVKRHAEGLHVAFCFTQASEHTTTIMLLLLWCTPI